jgi:NAD-dependent deacetylase
MDLIGKIEQAVDILRQSEPIVVFSGAGMSAESGIPTFRDPGGIWTRFDPEELGTGPGLMQTLARHPDRIRSFLEDTIDIFLSAKPNPGHLALGTMEQMGILRTVITQNIDNLHQDAGNSRVMEMHGNIFRQRCLACGKKKIVDKTSYLLQIRKALQEIRELELNAILRALPQCSCGSPMRPDVVMFGEAVQELYESFQEADNCSAMLVLGTSGVVYPAAALPQKAKEAGSKVIEINPGESVYTGIVDLQIPEKTGQVLPQILERLQNA